MTMVFTQSIQHLIREDEPLSGFTWARVGGAAKYFAEPGTQPELAQILSEAAAAGIPARIVGEGANILVRDAGYDGLVISLKAAEFSKVSIKDNVLTAGAGASLSQVVSASAGAGLAGIEYLAGIPGTFGGALVCNASVKNGDLGCRVTHVVAIEADGKSITLGSDQLRFGFQRSNLDGRFVIEAALQLETVDSAELTRRMQSSWIVKRAAQPASGQRALQAFVEPDGMSLSDVLEQSGVQGLNEGEISLSKQYPGYLVFSGEVKADEIIKFVQRVTTKVEAATGIRLHCPIKIW
ncbi:MAG TPA: UDP-N-acetylenolpyruvoylglucosamine reductase [Planctomycetaceae bacterium]|nr:UDP-N-acetylenolpyruvoylglucosamine reductase [Planctomycetaceae bacterium]